METTNEWKTFIPSKKWLGLHARFKQCGIINGKYQEHEIVGLVVERFNPEPWLCDIEIKADNNCGPYVFTKDGEWKYFYKDL